MADAPMKLVKDTTLKYVSSAFSLQIYGNCSRILSIVSPISSSFFWGPWYHIISMAFIPEVNKSWMPCHHGNEILYGEIWYLWVLSIELSSCHFSDAYNFDVAARYLENLCTPVFWFFNLGLTYLVYDILQMLSQQKDNFNNEEYLFNSITKLLLLLLLLLVIRAQSQGSSLHCSH
jgi:hypothetical protein